MLLCTDGLTQIQTSCSLSLNISILRPANPDPTYVLKNSLLHPDWCLEVYRCVCAPGNVKCICKCPWVVVLCSASFSSHISMSQIKIETHTCNFFFLCPVAIKAQFSGLVLLMIWSQRLPSWAGCLRSQPCLFSDSLTSAHGESDWLLCVLTEISVCWQQLKPRVLHFGWSDMSLVHHSSPFTATKLGDILALANKMICEAAICVVILHHQQMVVVTWWIQI